MPDHLAVGIHQRPATVAWIDGSVGLDIESSVSSGANLPPHGAHHAQADGILQTQRVSECQHH